VQLFLQDKPAKSLKILFLKLFAEISVIVIY